MDGLSKIEKNNIQDCEFENPDQDKDLSEKDKEADIKKTEEEPNKTKVKRESFLDKLTKNLQDFLDNAE